MSISSSHNDSDHDTNTSTALKRLAHYQHHLLPSTSHTLHTSTTNTNVNDTTILSTNHTSSPSSPTNTSPSSSLSDLLLIQPHIQQAIQLNQPVIALESTIITHGMPYPSNYDTAREVENIVKQHGCIPATIAILNGKICVGISDEQLKYLSELGTKAHKCSRRDLAYICARKGYGSTTVCTLISTALLHVITSHLFCIIHHVSLGVIIHFWILQSAY